MTRLRMIVSLTWHPSRAPKGGTMVCAHMYMHVPARARARLRYVRTCARGASASELVCSHVSQIREVTRGGAIQPNDNQATPDRQEPGHTDDGPRTRAHRASNVRGHTHHCTHPQTPNPLYTQR